MGFIKGFGGNECACEECGPAPCTPGCPCTFDSGAQSGSADFLDTYDVTGEFILEREVSLVGGFGECDDPSVTGRFRVYADGATIYDSGCVYSATVTGLLTIPAGTTEIKVELVYCTGAGGDLCWEYQLTC